MENYLKPKSIVLVLLIAIVPLIVAPVRARFSPSGSFLGTHTFTDDFRCNTPPVDTTSSSTYSTTPGDQGVQNGEFNVDTICEYLPPFYNGVGGYLSLVGEGGSATNSGTITGDVNDCGQEGGSSKNCFAFYIPNDGQSYTPVDISTDAYVVGGLYVSTNGNCTPWCGNAQATATLQLSVVIQAIGTGTTWTISLISDPISCTSNSANNWNNCSNSKNYGSDYQTTPQTFTLPSGYYYSATLQAKISVTGILTPTDFNSGGGQADYECFDYNSNCTNGDHASSCQRGVPVYNGQCQYIQWKWMTLTTHDPDFSVYTPSSVSLKPSSSTSIALTVNNILVNGNNAYSLSAPITISATSNDPSLGFTSSTVNPPPGGSVSTSITVSDSSKCDSGSYTITLTASVNDAAGQVQSSHTYSIPITVSGNHTCKK